MMNSNLFIIVKNGWSYLAYALAAFFIFTFLDFDFLAFLTLLLGAFFIYIFRNPERELATFGKESIVSPVDGTVTQIVELEDSMYAYRIDIVSNYFDVSVLRVPMNALVKSIQKRSGTRLSSESKLFDDLNERCEIILENEKEDLIKIEHILTQSFVPLCVDIIPSQSIYQTSRYGFMLSGKTSIYLPANVRINVHVANKIEASQTLIGYFS